MNEEKSGGSGWAVLGLWIMSILLGWIPILGWGIVLATLVCTVMYFSNKAMGE